MAKFICVPYPFLRVLIERSASSTGGDKFAEFNFGNYETNDKKEIDILRATPYVHEDSAIDLQSVSIEPEQDKPVIVRQNRLSDTERARLAQIKR